MDHNTIMFVGPAVMAGWYFWQWYQDKVKAFEATQTTRIVSYNNETAANYGIHKMVQDKWTVKSINTSDGHINIGRTATYTILTGGIALLLGGSRTSGKITVLFERKDAIT
jgi:hypothetical protein